MPKRPPPSAFKLEPPVAVRDGPPAAAAGPAPPPPQAGPAAAAPAPTARARGETLPAGCKAVTFYPSKDAHLQLRLLAGRAERTANDLLLEALDDFFGKHGMSRIARPAKPAAAAAAE